MTGALLAKWLLDGNSGMLVSAVLTQDSQRLILERVPPIHPWVKAHHMTIAFDPPVERFAHYYRPAIGQGMTLTVIGVAQDEKGQAVRVEAESENPNPHITISCADGVAARYSNDLLSQGWQPVQPFTLEAIIEVEELLPDTQR